AAASSSPPIVLEEGSTVDRPLVAVGRDLEVRGRAASEAAAVGGSVRVVGEVRGNVVALGGDVSLERGARVDGDVFALGGTIEDAGGAVVGGRLVAFPDVSPGWLVLAEAPALGLSPLSPTVIAIKLSLLVAWTLLSIALLASAAPALASTARAVADEPLRSFTTGVIALLAVVLLVVLFASTLDAVLGVPLVVLGVLLAFVLKLWGVVAVFCWLGAALRRGSTPEARLAPRDVLLGLIVLGGLKLVPIAGTWLWTAATLVGMGAALTTKFGRREPWLERA
ncbi:MAG: polymer-forming cytoskeletal protein, partial [Thermoanaerobaculia bacterium]|nr:polymer-forming cytoskeletal protein [Thermoanaerobaculia bacterium]